MLTSENEFDPLLNHFKKHFDPLVIDHEITLIQFIEKYKTISFATMKVHQID